MPATIKTVSFLLAVLTLTTQVAVSQDQETVDEDLGAFVNLQLAEAEADYRVIKLETYSAGETAGATILFDDRAKRLPLHFVPGDPRRSRWSGDPEEFEDDITCTVDGREASTSSGLSDADVIPAIWRAMDTWNAVKSTHIPITQNGRFGPVTPFNVGVMQRSLGFGGIPIPFADIVHAGILPKEFFDLLSPNGGNRILGVTFTFIFVSGGAPTDINKDGRIDVAFREIYYNDNFPWSIDGNVDVQTVALHEAGHGLSQGHFGKLFRTDKNGKFHFAPRAVMNAGYTGVQQSLTGTDIAGDSSIWASWPLK